MAALSGRHFFVQFRPWLARRCWSIADDRGRYQRCRSKLLAVIYAHYGKRALDIFVSATLLFALRPALILLAIGVKISSPGPAIYRQMRTGRNGKLFQLLKFRSMPANTKEVASDLLGDVELQPFGRFIRRISADELPQLVNILRGDMSLVGPRPPLPSQVDLIRERQRNGSIAFRPGLTGLAQIRGFDGMTVAQKAGYDLAYCQTVSFWRDLLILARTFAYLLRPPPTY